MHLNEQRRYNKEARQWEMCDQLVKPMVLIAYSVWAGVVVVVTRALISLLGLADDLHDHSPGGPRAAVLEHPAVFRAAAVRYAAAILFVFA